VGHPVKISGRKGRAAWADESSSGFFDCVTHDETVSHAAQDDNPHIDPIISITKLSMRFSNEQLTMNN
jgi:hypothetical protein